MTGLYPEAHGIVANLFYDPDMNAVFSHSNSTSTADHKWWKGEPVSHKYIQYRNSLKINSIVFKKIWTTSKMHRQRTGSIMWPGSETNYNPPDMVVKYNGTMGTREKIDTTLQWLDLEYDKRPQMITVYCPEIDQEGHRGGPHSRNVSYR